MQVAPELHAKAMLLVNELEAAAAMLKVVEVAPTTIVLARLLEERLNCAEPVPVSVTPVPAFAASVLMVTLPLRLPVPTGENVTEIEHPWPTFKIVGVVTRLPQVFVSA